MPCSAACAPFLRQILVMPQLEAIVSGSAELTVTFECDNWSERADLYGLAVGVHRQLLLLGHLHRDQRDMRLWSAVVSHFRDCLVRHAAREFRSSCIKEGPHALQHPLGRPGRICRVAFRKAEPHNLQLSSAARFLSPYFPAVQADLLTPHPGVCQSRSPL